MYIFHSGVKHVACNSGKRVLTALSASTLLAIDVFLFHVPGVAFQSCFQNHLKTTLSLQTATILGDGFCNPSQSFNVTNGCTEESGHRALEQGIQVCCSLIFKGDHKRPMKTT